MSLKEKIIAAKDYDSEIHEVPEWGVTVELRSMMAKTRNQISMKFLDEKGNVSDSAALAMEVLVASLFDPETGEPIFELSEVEELNKKSGRVIDPLLMAAMSINGFGKDSVKEAEKNS